MGRKENPLFHLGKGFENDNQRTPMQGEPNTNLDTRVKATGMMHRRRKYGPNGYALKDLDVADEHKPYDHAHDISKDNRPSEDRLLTKKEQRELDKAKKKRKLPKNDR